ncbi:hypothetical protein BDZ89DRAFT_1111830 [Hymenopellis radicata]|nr:hypothetical protein BDZ89DRAFT_1111830 [Hymenopellis radicata]
MDVFSHSEMSTGAPYYPPHLPEEPDSSPDSTSRIILDNLKHVLPKRRRHKNVPQSRPRQEVIFPHSTSAEEEPNIYDAPDVAQTLRYEVEMMERVHRIQTGFHDQLSEARSSLEVQKTQLLHARQEIQRAQQVILSLDQQRMEAEAQAAKDRATARRLVLQRCVEEAREMGYNAGYQEGLGLGRAVHRSTLTATKETRRTPSNAGRSSSVTESVLAKHDQREERIRVPVYPNPMAAVMQTGTSSQREPSTTLPRREEVSRAASTPPQLHEEYVRTGRKRQSSQPFQVPPRNNVASSSPHRTDSGQLSGLHAEGSTGRNRSKSLSSQVQRRQVPSSPEMIQPIRSPEQVPPVPPLPTNLNIYGPPNGTVRAQATSTRASTPLSQYAMLKPQDPPPPISLQTTPTQRIVQEWRSRNSDSTPSPQVSNTSANPRQVNGNVRAPLQIYAPPQSSPRGPLRSTTPSQVGERQIVQPVPLAVAINGQNLVSPRRTPTPIYRPIVSPGPVSNGRPSPAPPTVRTQSPSPPPVSPPRRTKTPIAWLRRQFNRSYSSPGVDILIEPPSQPPSNPPTDPVLNPVLLTPEAAEHPLPPLPDEGTHVTVPATVEEAFQLAGNNPAPLDNGLPGSFVPDSHNAFFSPIPQLQSLGSDRTNSPPAMANGHAPEHRSRSTSPIGSFGGYGGFASPPASFNRPISLFSND